MNNSPSQRQATILLNSGLPPQAWMAGGLAKSFLVVVSEYGNFCIVEQPYLAFCASRGEAPDKPDSGRFLLRVDPALHRKLVELSAHDGESLNNWIASRLSELAEST